MRYNKFKSTYSSTKGVKFLLQQAAQLPQYQDLVDEAVKYGEEKGNTREEQLSLAMDKIACLFGREISEAVPGYVSTEVLTL